MADISNELTAINTNPYGNAVRTAIEDSCKSITDSTNSILNAQLFRGKELGSGSTFEQASTPAQRQAIQNGTFEDMFIGDYWTIDNKIFRIADFDYWYNVGDTAFTNHHLVIVPDASFGNGKMNNTNITTGAYTGSELDTDQNSVLNTARATISNLFGSYLGTHRTYLANAVIDGAESAGAWMSRSIDLMSEIMVYGCHIRANSRNGSYFYTAEKTQLALFRLRPEFIVNKRFSYWLRDVVSSTHFALINIYGNAGYGNASYAYEVRPAFPLVVLSN